MTPRLSHVATAARLVDGRLELVFDPAVAAHPAWARWLRSPPEEARHPSVAGLAPLVGADPVIGLATWTVGEARPVSAVLAERGASPRASFDLLAGLMHVAVTAVAAHGPLGLIGPDTVCIGPDGAPLVVGWGLPTPMVAALDGSWQPTAAAIRYAAPELLDGGAPDLRSTAFGLAMLAAEVGLGRPVLAGEAADVLEAALVGVRPDALGPPGPGRDLLAAALSRDPRTRFDPRRLAAAAAEVRAEGPPLTAWAGADNEVRSAPTWLASIRAARAARAGAIATALQARQDANLPAAEALDAAIFRFDRASLGVDDGNATVDPTTSTEVTLALRLLRVAAEAGRAMVETAQRTSAARTASKHPAPAVPDVGPGREIDALRDAAIAAVERAARCAADPLLHPAGLHARAGRLLEECREASDTALRLVDVAGAATASERTGQLARARVATERARRAASEVERLVEAARQIDATARAAEARAASDAVLRAERARVQGGSEPLLDQLVDEASRSAEAALTAGTLEAARAARADAEGAATRAESALAGILAGRAERAAVVEREAVRSRQREEALAGLAGLAAEASADRHRIREARAQLGDGDGDSAALDAAVSAVDDWCKRLVASVDGDPIDLLPPRQAARESLRSAVRLAEDELAATRKRWAAALAAAETERIRRAAVAAAAVEAGAVATSARQRVDQTRAVLRGLLDDVERLEVSACLPLLERAAAVLDVADFHVSEAERAAEQAASQTEPDDARAHARTAASFAERISSDLPEADEALEQASRAVGAERVAYDDWLAVTRATASEARALAAQRITAAADARTAASALGWDEPADLVAALDRVTIAVRAVDRAEEALTQRGARPRGPSALDEAVLGLGGVLADLGEQAVALSARCAAERDGRARREAGRIRLVRLLQDAGDAVHRASVELTEETRVLAGGGSADVADALRRAHEHLEAARSDARRLQEVAADGLAFDGDVLTDVPDELASSIRVSLAALESALADAAMAAEEWEASRRTRLLAARATGRSASDRASAAWAEVLEAAGRAGIGREDPAWQPRMDEVAGQLTDATRLSTLLGEVDAPEEADTVVADVEAACEAVVVGARRLVAGLLRQGEEHRLAAEDAMAIGALRMEAAEVAVRGDALHHDALGVMDRVIAEADDADRVAAEGKVRGLLAQLSALAARARTAAETVDAGSRRAAEGVLDAQRQGVARMERMLVEMRAIADAAAEAAQRRADEAWQTASGRAASARDALAARRGLMAGRIGSRVLPAEIAARMEASRRPDAAPTEAPTGTPERRRAAAAAQTAAEADEAALIELDVVSRWLDEHTPTPVPRPRVARKVIPPGATLLPEEVADAAHARLRRSPDAPVAVASRAVALRDALRARGLSPVLMEPKETPVPIPRETRPTDDAPALHGRLRRSSGGDG